MEYKSYATDLREKVVLEYEHGDKTYDILAEEYQIPRNTIASWVRRKRIYVKSSEKQEMIEISSIINGSIQQTQQDDAVHDIVHLRMDGHDLEIATADLRFFLEAMKHG